MAAWVDGTESRAQSDSWLSGYRGRGSPEKANETAGARRSMPPAAGQGYGASILPGSQGIRLETVP